MQATLEYIGKGHYLKGHKNITSCKELGGAKVARTCPAIGITCLT